MVEIKIIKNEKLIKEYYVQECCVDYENKKIICKAFDFNQYIYESIERGLYGNGMPYFNVTIKD